MKTSPCHSSLTANRIAAPLLAAAVAELFPGALFLSGEGTPLYFFYDFILPFPFQPGLLALIEERMRMILKEKRGIRALEMTPSNAAEKMRYQGQYAAADLLSCIDRATVPLCQIGEGVFYVPDPISEQAVIPFFKLFEGISFIRPCEGQESTVVRLIGSAGDKPVVKELFKKGLYSARSHRDLVERAQLLTPQRGHDSWIWRPRGEQVRRTLIQWWEKQLEERHVSLVSFPLSLSEEGERALIQAHLDYFSRFQQGRVAHLVQLMRGDAAETGREGLLSSGCFYTDRTYLFCGDPNFLEECISSLHFILQIPKILGFEFEVVLTVSLEAAKSLRSQSVSLWEKALKAVGLSWQVERVVGTPFLTCVEVRIQDALGRKWAGPFVGIPVNPLPVGAREAERVLVCSAMGSLERLVALLIEHTAGWLPLWLSPEQVRVIALTPSVRGYAEQVCHRLLVEGMRASVMPLQGRLKDQLEQALENRVPYVIPIGEKERVENRMTVCRNPAKQEQTLSLDEFCMELHTLCETSRG